MTGMFAVRRLIESGKCSSRLPKRRLPVQLCAMTGSEPDLLERWTPWEHYDMENVRPAEIDVWSLAQQFIHSYILMLDFAANDNALTGIFIGSDFTKRTHLYRVDIHTVVDLFAYVAQEDVVHASQYRLDGTTKRFTISQHDLVEAGLAEYHDESREFVRYVEAIQDDKAVRAAFPELGDYTVTQFRTPSWSDRVRGVREI